MNNEGQLGDGSTHNSSVPVTVSDLSGVKAIGAGDAHGLALLKSKTVMAWGENEFGELGDGTLVELRRPGRGLQPDQGEGAREREAKRNFSLAST